MDFKFVKTFTFIITTLALSILGIVYCTAPHSQITPRVRIQDPVLDEAFYTRQYAPDNVDNPALWHGPDGQNWLLATSKAENAVIVFDAATGKKINSFGITDGESANLSNPKGIAVIDSIAIIVDQDNHRLQVFSLPSMASLGYFGQDQLLIPSGITADKTSLGYEIYVTDNYGIADEIIVPANSLDHRVHHFVLNLLGNKIHADHLNAFGDTSGEGILYQVESILIDRPLNRILIADEYKMQRNIKIYTTSGKFTGEILPHEYFMYKPEAIALWSCDADSSGYYITTDQDVLNNFFPIFDRKTLKYRGRFSGKITRNTDGVALTQKSLGDFPNGAFYSVHDNGGITAIGWNAVADSLRLRRRSY